MELIHVLNRGVDKRKIFLNTGDYLRFIHDLFELNNQDSVNTTYRIFNKNYVVGRRTLEIEQKRKPRKLLVDIAAFCLMPNHYHLLVTPRAKNGIALFMKKINGGYARYFNEKYKRSGALFQGKYKKIVIKNEAHFIYLPYYIHFNPLDLITPEWRERTLRSYKKAITFLEMYRWSSHLDYCGKKNFPSITNREPLLAIFGGYDRYQKNVEKWLKGLDTSKMRNYILE